MIIKLKNNNQKITIKKNMKNLISLMKFKEKFFKNLHLFQINKN